MKRNSFLKKLGLGAAAVGVMASTPPHKNSVFAGVGDNLAPENNTTVRPIEYGGTGASTAAGARTNLGIPPISHASADKTYGVGTTDLYGHNKVINDLTHSSFSVGEVLSAYQGYVLNNVLASKVDDSDPRLSDARTPTSHTHDDRYYTESETDAKLNAKQNTLSVTSKTISTGLILYSYGNIRILHGNGCFATSNGNFGNVGSGNYPKLDVRTNGTMILNSSKNYYSSFITVTTAGAIKGSWYTPTSTTAGDIGTAYSNYFTLVWVV